jgi:hypothetical protein
MWGHAPPAKNSLFIENLPMNFIIDPVLLAYHW